jgi:hypothetical protein
LLHPEKWMLSYTHRTGPAWSNMANAGNTVSQPREVNSAMPNSKALAALRTAILEERMAHQDAQKVLDRYKDFTAKLTEFQTRDGPSPTREEFEVWRSDILLIWAIREEQLKFESLSKETPSDPD